MKKLLFIAILLSSCVGSRTFKVQEQRASHLYERGLYRESMEAYRKLANQGYKNKSLIRGVALNHFEMGRYKKTKRLTLKFYSLFREDTKMNYILAESLRMLKEHKKALTFYKRAYKDRDLKVVKGLLSNYRELRKSALAYKIATKVYREEALDQETKILLMRIFLEERDFRKVRTLIAGTKFKSSLEPIVLAIQGEVYRKQRSYQKAIAYYYRALKIDPILPFALEGLQKVREGRTKDSFQVSEARMVLMNELSGTRL